MLRVSMEQHLIFAGLRFHFTSIIWELQYSESFVGYFVYRLQSGNLASSVWVISDSQ